MAHYMKHPKTALGHLGKHYERGKDESSEYVKFGNPQIDPQRTHLNYNLAPQHNHMEFIKQRLSEVYCLNRKDVNVMCSWVVTAPKDLEPSQQEDFFKESYKFLENRYEKENVISSYVHLDETTPHMHFAFIPVVYDKKKDRYKVSAKERVNKFELKSFHSDYQKHLDRTNIRCNVLNEATREGNKSIDELKRKSAIERLEEVKEKTSEMVSKAEREVKDIKYKIMPLEAEYEAKKAYVREADKLSDVSVMYPKEVKIIEKGFINKQKFVLVPEKMWEAKHISANEKSYLERATDELDKSIKKINNTDRSKNIKTLTNRVIDLEDKNRNLEYRNKHLEKRINKIYDNINKTIEILPKDLASEFIKTLEKVTSKIHERGLER